MFFMENICGYILCKYNCSCLVCTLKLYWKLTPPKKFSRRCSDNYFSSIFSIYVISSKKTDDNQPPRFLNHYFYVVKTLKLCPFFLLFSRKVLLSFKIVKGCETYESYQESSYLNLLDLTKTTYCSYLLYKECRSWSPRVGVLCFNNTQDIGCKIWVFNHHNSTMKLLTWRQPLSGYWDLKMLGMNPEMSLSKSDN